VTASLYWASGPARANIISDVIDSETITATAGFTSGVFPLPDAVPPAGATHIVLIERVAPGTPEINEDNNSASVVIPHRVVTVATHGFGNGTFDPLEFFVPWE
jgi:hypothetical protein